MSRLRVMLTHFYKQDGPSNIIHYPIVSYNVIVEPSIKCKSHSQCNISDLAELLMSGAHSSEYL